MKTLLWLALVLLLAGCSKDIQNKEAVRQGVLDYLNARAAQTGLDMSAMDVEVTAMTFQRDEARATVAFKTKNGAGGMDMNYAFDRKGDKWVVRGGPTGMSTHGQTAPGDAPAVGGGGLPPGHPAIDPNAPGTPTPGAKQ